MKNGEIISWANDICLFCGKNKKQKWEENTSYYECDCPDAEKKRKLEEQIEDIKRKMPKEKFTIRQEYVLYKNK